MRGAAQCQTGQNSESSHQGECGANCSRAMWASGLTLIGAFLPAGLCNLSIYTRQLQPLLLLSPSSVCARVQEKCEGDADAGGCFVTEAEMAVQQGGGRPPGTAMG